MATVTRENIGLLNDKITVKVAKEDYLSSFEKSLKNYSKNANIPGFRKGMVPTGIIKKMHGQAVFTDEILRTVEKELTNYMTNEKLEIFAQPLPLPENDARQFDMNNPAEYAFAFEVGLKPEVTIPDLPSQSVTLYKVNVTDEMINDEVERLRLRHGKMTEPESVSSDDNVINVTFSEVDADSNEVEGGTKHDNSLLVKYFNEDIRQQLQGLKSGDSLVIEPKTAFTGKEKEAVLRDLAIDENSDKKFKMSITKVGHVDKAELNEEFFKAAYPAKAITNETELREAVKEEIQSYWDNESRNHLQHEVYHILLDHTKMEFPENFLKKWMLNGTETAKTPEQVEQEYPSFVNQLKWTLITDAITKDNEISVQREDLMAFARKQLFGYLGMGALDESQPWITDYLNRMMSDRKFVEDAYHRIQIEKVFEVAENKIQKVEKPVTVEEFTAILSEHQHHHH